MNMIDGGWTIHEEISEELLEVFNEATSGLMGVKYEPKIAATKVIKGIEYIFICVSSIVIPDGPKSIAQLYIYKGWDGKPVLTKIESIL